MQHHLHFIASVLCWTLRDYHVGVNGEEKLAYLGALESEPRQLTNIED